MNPYPQPKRHALLLVCVVLLGSWVAAQADDGTKKPAAAPKDVICSGGPGCNGSCENPGTRTALLKAYLKQQTVTGQTGTNAVKACDKPPSRAGLLPKGKPATK